MDATNLGLQAPNGSPLDSNDSNATAAEWARTPGRWWVTKRVDVVRGLIQRLDLTENLLRALLLGLMGYAVYLAWCEGCKNEYYEFAVALWTAVVDFVSLSRGQFSAAMVGGALDEGLRTAGCVNKKASCATKTKVTKFCKKGKGLRDCFALCSPQCQGGAFPTNVLS